MDNNIKNITKNLNKDELEALILLLQEKIKKIFTQNLGLECPKCKCSDLNKNGISNGRQRYICKACETTFDQLSGSPFSSSKLDLDYWLKYAELMLLGKTIRYCAKELDVCVKTSFYMKTRLLDLLNTLI